MTEKHPPVFFYTEDHSFQLPNETLVSQWISSILVSEGKEPGNIEYIFCSDDYLLEINRKYLDHDYYTDIISFPLEEEPLEATIFVSIDRVKDNAGQLGVSFTNELHRVLAHGVLHLAGYTDKTDDEESEMRQKENEYLYMRPAEILDAGPDSTTS